MNNQEIGQKGEKYAAEYLQKNGYIILEKNFECRQGEIDIIALDKKEIVFVEVKTRTNFNYGDPVEAVTKLKQKHMKKATEYYIYINNLLNEYIRFDVVEVVLYGDKYTINHIKQAME